MDITSRGSGGVLLPLLSTLFCLLSPLLPLGGIIGAAAALSRGPVGPLLFDGLAGLLIHAGFITPAFQVSFDGCSIYLTITFPYFRIVIGHAPAVLWVVTPRLAVDVPRGSVDVDVTVDIDINPAPGPVGMIPAVGKCRTNHHTGDERERGRGGIPNIRGMGGIKPGSIDIGAAVRRHINDVGLGGFNDNSVAFLYYLLFFRALQVSLFLCLGAEFLHHVQDGLLILEEVVAEFLRGIQVLIHGLKDGGEMAERFYTHVPLLFLQCLVQGIILQFFMLPHETGGLHDLKGIC